MPSTASPLLKLELQATGENNNTWGDKANTVFELIEDAIAEVTSVTLSTGDYTLSDTEYVANESRSMVLVATGALSGNSSIIVPTRDKMYLVSNETTNAFSVTVKTAAGTGVVVPQDKKAMVYCDGTNVEGFIGDDYVEGPASATDNAIVRFDGTTGDAIQNSGVTIDDNNIVSFPAQIRLTKGADIASAAPLVLGTDGNYFDVTGTTGFAAITVAAGTFFVLQFDGALVLTHHATNLNLPGAANITTAAGDRAICFAEAANQVRVLDYVRAAALPVYPNASTNMTVGFTATATNEGTKSSGTFTPDPATGNLKYYTNGGAHTLAPPSATGDYTIVIQVTNNGSAGTITTSGFTIVTGDTITTTNGHDFFFYITKLNGFTQLHVTALQ